MTTGPDQDDALIPRKWGPVLSAALTAAATLVVWLATLVIQLDARLDAMERKLFHLTTSGGEARPSQLTLENAGQIRALESRVSQRNEPLLQNLEGRLQRLEAERRQ